MCDEIVKPQDGFEADELKTGDESAAEPVVHLPEVVEEAGVGEETPEPEIAKATIRLEKKHPLAIRWMHWVNFPVLFTMIWSGLLIYWNDSDNAYKHPVVVQFEFPQVWRGVVVSGMMEGMKPRRPAVKDSIKQLGTEGAKRKSAQVAARAARKAEAKRRKDAEEEDINQAAARIVREATER